MVTSRAPELVYSNKIWKYFWLNLFANYHTRHQPALHMKNDGRFRIKLRNKDLTL